MFGDHLIQSRGANDMKLYDTVEEYYADHEVCPKCGGDTSSTYMGFIFYKGQPFKEENIRRCGCGWRGITDDLVRRKHETK